MINYLIDIKKDKFLTIAKIKAFNELQARLDELGQPPMSEIKKLLANIFISEEWLFWKNQWKSMVTFIMKHRKQITTDGMRAGEYDDRLNMHNNVLGLILWKEEITKDWIITFIKILEIKSGLTIDYEKDSPTLQDLKDAILLVKENSKQPT